MGKNKQTPITVNDKEYIFQDMTEQQQAMVNHINDLDRKLASARFNVEQLSFGREKFFEELVKSLEAQDEVDE